MSKLPNVGDRFYTVRFDLSTWEDEHHQLIMRQTVSRVETEGVLGNRIFYKSKRRGDNEQVVLGWFNTLDEAKAEVRRYIESERDRLNLMESHLNEMEEES